MFQCGISTGCAWAIDQQWSVRILLDIHNEFSHIAVGAPIVQAYFFFLHENSFWRWRVTVWEMVERAHNVPQCNS